MKLHRRTILLNKQGVLLSFQTQEEPPSALVNFLCAAIKLNIGI